MFKQLLLKKLITSQLQGVPEAQKQMVLAAVEKDPDFFMRLAEEAEAKTKNGMDRNVAARQVFEAHADELRKALGQ